MKKEITVVPYAGLCNRLNSITSAISYKKENPDVNLRILWFKCSHCNCRFSDLFEPLTNTCLQVSELKSLVKDRPGTKFNLFIPKLLRFLWYDIEITPRHISDRFDEYISGKNKIYVYKDNRFCMCSVSKSLSSFFKPTEELCERIKEQISSWKGRCVGLHIRRTDNVRSIEGSPLSYFYKVIEREIAIDPNTIFYLATDDLKVKQELILKYGSRIKYTDLCLERGSVKGMKDAVVDLWCLAHTDIIYGSKASTYSAFASQIFDKPLII